MRNGQTKFREIAAPTPRTWHLGDQGRHGADAADRSCCREQLRDEGEHGGELLGDHDENLIIVCVPRKFEAQKTLISQAFHPLILLLMGVSERRLQVLQQTEN